MKNFTELKKQVERDLLVNLLLSLKHKRLTRAEVKKVSGEFVSLEFANYEDLFGKLYQLSNKSREVRKVYVKHAPVYYFEKDAQMLSDMRQYLEMVVKGGA